MSIKTFLLYGAYGYTGQLITQHAIEKGLRPVLAGRNQVALERLASRHDLPYLAFGLDDPDKIHSALEKFHVVLNCAGPFSATAAAMVDGCLETGAHYLDITGEIEVMKSLYELSDRASAQNIMLMPGTGFDIVPSDCLSLYLKQRMPDATKLSLGLFGISGVSQGTAITYIENMGKGGVVRQKGALTPVPSAWNTRQIDFGDGEIETVTVPWADVFTAHLSTGIPDIEVYLAAPKSLMRMIRGSRTLGGLLSLGPVQGVLKTGVRQRKAGPSDEERASGRTAIWGEVENATSEKMTAILSCPEGYTLTAMTAVEIVRRVLDGNYKGGFQTPAMLFGSEFIMGFDGVTRRDV